MSDFLLDWSALGADGLFSLFSSGGDSLGVSISTPTSGCNTSFFIDGNGNLASNDVTQATTTILTFDEAVSDVSFSLYDVDASHGQWDDKVTILAYDADGNLVPVDFSNVNTSLQTVNGNTIEGTTNGDTDINGAGDTDTVDVNIAGPIVRLEIIHDNGDSYHESGYISVSDLSFNLADVLGDGIVEGTDGGDIIDGTYLGDPDGDLIDALDAILPGEVGNDDIVTAGAGNDWVDGAEGNDEIFGGTDHDTLIGGVGDDVIFGDSSGPDGDPTVRESFNWSQLPDQDYYGHGTVDDGDDLEGLTLSQNTGTVTVTVTTPDDYASGLTTEFETQTINVAGIDGGDETVNSHSSLESFGSHGNGDGTYVVEFSDSVTNVDFRVNDIDANRGQVTIRAYDADGNLIPVTLTAGSDLILSDTDAQAGDDTALATGNGDSDDSNNSLLVEIDGPVSRIEIDHVNAGTENTAIYISDIFFDATIAGPGDATGNDVLAGGLGADALFGEGGDDLFVVENGFGADTIVGGETGEHNGDFLDARSMTDDANVVLSAPETGTITSGGDTAEFSEIENILLGAGDDTVAGSTGDDVVALGAGDDIAELGDGNDSLWGEAGDDTLTGGAGVNYLDGGDGDDVFVGGEGADGFSGGRGQDNIDYSSSDEAVNVQLFNDGTGVLSGGDAANDTVYGGIDGVIGSEFNDTLVGFDASSTDPNDAFTNEFFGEGGDDYIDGAGGGDLLDGGLGNDTILGGDGDDTISAGVDQLGAPDLGYPGLFDADDNPTDDLDSVDGGAGNDIIFTGDDADTILGGSGSDTIDGGVDADVISGGDDNDYIVGGEGADDISGDDGDDTIYGGLDPSFPDSLNIVDALDAVQNNGTDTIDGGAGNDLIFGQDDDDLIDGGTGNDTIDGGIDEDTIFGGTGADSIIGGQGDDLIDAGFDTDADVLRGNEDADTFTGATAGDSVFGGSGGNDFDTLDLRGTVPTGGSYILTNLTTDSDGNGFDGTVQYFDASGADAGTVQFNNIENIIPCFTPGTTIATPRGEVLVETLREGDKVITRDNGIQEIRWVGERTLDGRELSKARHLRPIMIKAGSLGQGLPERDMLVSPNHRVLVSNDRTALYFEEREVLVAAKHLVNNSSIQALDTTGTTYIHFMFDQHEVVLSNGSWTESFQPGDYTLKGMGNAQRNEIFELFPELQSDQGLQDYTAARKTLKRHEAKILQL